MSKQHDLERADALLVRIGDLARYARPEAEVRAFEERVGQAEAAARVATMDAGLLFERKLASVIGQHETEGREAVRAAAVAFIAERIGALYGIEPDPESVGFVAQFYGPRIAKKVAADMISEGADARVRFPFAVFKSRALKICNARRPAS